ncbi:hypothetical protein NDU88_010059 [Pleurodeles waltl]|uniref:Uncharacterized protein n=1 Tax=Pleurodeles waltl TaxID=8319 RepID=A0AAV7S0S6_PLEWA|nr:hypothetical protein NDU88_010059 [Pleurodeles waltl]
MFRIADATSVVPVVPGGIKTRETLDPEALRAETNHVLLPGDGRQKQPLRAITWFKGEKKDGSGESSVGTDRKDRGREEERKGSKNYDRIVPDGGCVETSGEDLRSSTSTAGNHRGPGGTTTRTPATLREERSHFRCVGTYQE